MKHEVKPILVRPTRPEQLIGEGAALFRSAYGAERDFLTLGGETFPCALDRFEFGGQKQVLNKAAEVRLHGRASRLRIARA